MRLANHYRIQVKGHLPAAWSDLLEGMQVTCQPDGSTTLSGPVRDQAQLYGLIAKLQNLGLTLISVNPTREPPFRP
jgi:hypothetical protein